MILKKKLCVPSKMSKAIIVYFLTASKPHATSMMLAFTTVYWKMAAKLRVRSMKAQNSTVSLAKTRKPIVVLPLPNHMIA